MSGIGEQYYSMQVNYIGSSYVTVLRLIYILRVSALDFYNSRMSFYFHIII